MLRFRFRSSLVAVAIGFILGACGGGGEVSSGGPPPPRTGGGGNSAEPPIDAASLDRKRTRDFAATLIAELRLASDDSERVHLHQFLTRATELLANIEQPCPGGGRIDETQRLNSDLTGTIEMTFHDCVDGGVRQSGALGIRINEYDAEAREATDYVVTFHDLAFTVRDRSTVASGTAAVTSDGAKRKTSFNLRGRYTPEGVVVRMENLVTLQTDLRMTVSGRLHHSEYGFVDVTTLEELRFDDADAREPASGVLRLTGANNATADIVFGGGRIRVSLDADANGRADAELAATWSELLGTDNFAPAALAGPDVTVAFGAAAALDASASGDWDGDELTYTWALKGRPPGSRATVSSTSATLSFVGDVQGAYDLEVTVRDAHGDANRDSVRVTVLAPGTLPPNAKPIAHAGADQATVERQGVVLDGSLSSDAENDPLTFAWELAQAPAGSTVVVQDTAASFTFTPDVPGLYELRLTADDGRGKASDTVRVIAEPLLAFVSGGNFRVDGASTAGSDRLDLALRTSAHYRGEPVTITVSSDVPWLIAAPFVLTSASAGATAAVPLQLVLSELARMDNGTFQARVSAAPSSGATAAATPVALNLRLPLVRNVAPYVAYSGQPSRVTLYGEELAQAHGRSLRIAGTEVPGISATSDRRATIELPPLPAGSYPVRISHALDIARESTRVVVRDEPAWFDAELSLPGAVRSLDYDAQRNSLYVVFQSDEGARSAARIRLDGGLQAEPIGVADALAVSLTADGTRLLVTAHPCVIYELDPDTLATLHSSTRQECLPAQPFGGIAALGDGRVLLIDDDQVSHVWQYPDFAETGVLPAVQYALPILGYERNRLLWAEMPAAGGIPRLFYYDAGSTSARPVDSPAGSTFTRSNLAISGNGARTVHNNAVFDGEMRFIGTLGRLSLAPGLGRSGNRAAVLDVANDSFAVYDVSGPGPVFPQIGGDVALHIDVAEGSVVAVSPSDAAGFFFVRSSPGWIPGTHADPYRLYVRRLF